MPRRLAGLRNDACDRSASGAPAFGTWCIVDVVEPDGTIRRLSVIHPDPAKQRLARELHRRYPPAPADLIGAPRVIRTGRTEIALAVPEEDLVRAAHDAEHLSLLRALGTESFMIVPLIARGQTLGAITFLTADAERRYGTTDIALAEDLASRGAMAIDNARLHRAAETARGVAEAASRAKSEFLAVVGHELRTPLNAIGGYAELLEMGLRGPVTPAQLKDLGRIRRAQERLLGLINDVLNFVRVETGRVQYNLTNIKLHPTLLSLETLIAPQVSAAQLTYACVGCDPALTVLADGEKLEQVLLNLLTNAIKFTPAGGHITLSCEPGAEQVRVLVRDSGVGIAADQLEAIFSPFVQVDKRLARENDGIGLGLAISRDLALGMGGRLTADSTTGVGSTFSLTLPRGR
jgi:signal transduction histidine kinase